MHKGIILLMQATSREEAISKTGEFLESYKDDVWDWYVIGGRWSGKLNKNFSLFYDKVKENNIKIEFYSDVEKEETQKALQEIWKGLGETSLNPMLRDSFLKNEFTTDKRFFLVEGVDFIVGQESSINKEYSDDILPLPECIDVVKDYGYNYLEAAGQEELDAKKWIDGTNNIKRETKEILAPDYRMYGYCLSIAAKHYKQDFHFDCNVYNIESGDYSIPEQTDDYYAVMIDIHN